MGTAVVLGAGAAVGVAAGEDNLRACVVKRTGELRATSPSGRCGRAELTITISGSAFKGRRGRTLTINGVSFRRGRGNTLTINGTAFRSRGNTLTINGTSFRTGTLPNTLTINGTSFSGSGQTLTINGTTFAPGAAGATGPAGPQGIAGPQGPAGTVAAGPAPAVVAGPVRVDADGQPDTLATATFSHSDGKAHRLLLAGGFSAECSGCGNDPVEATWRVTAGAAAVVLRDMPTFSPTLTQSGATLSEVVVTPGTCAPCTYSLQLSATTTASGGQPPAVNASAIRLGIVDLGPVAGA